MFKKIFPLIVFTFLCLTALPTLSCELVMGYRTSERLPLINKAPDNQGLYQQLYLQAAKNIGCSLTVERGPKKRILKRLVQGKIDFYPGFGFTEKRNQHFYFIDNGLHSHSVIMSHADKPDLSSLTQLRNKVLLVAHGSRSDRIKEHGAKIRFAQDISVASALSLLEQKKADYFIYNEASIDYYLKHHPSRAIKKHYCCFEQEPMYLGFSRYSKHFASQQNQDFDNSKRLSVTNLNTKLTPNSIVAKFANELKRLSSLKITQKLESKYYGSDHLKNTEPTLTKEETKNQL